MTPDARRSRRACRSSARVLHRVVHRAPHLEAQVRSREAGDRDVRIAHAELARDVGAHLGRRRRGEREDRRRPSRLRDRAEREVVGAEVVPPLAHAVRLVDDEQADGAREQPLEEVAVLEPLGREVEDLALALGDLPVRLARLAGRRDASASRARRRPARGACPAGPSSAR